MIWKVVASEIQRAQTCFVLGLTKYGVQANAKQGLKVNIIFGLRAPALELLDQKPHVA